MGTLNPFDPAIRAQKKLEILKALREAASYSLASLNTIVILFPEWENKVETRDGYLKEIQMVIKLLNDFVEQTPQNPLGATGSIAAPAVNYNQAIAQTGKNAVAKAGNVQNNIFPFFQDQQKLYPIFERGRDLCDAAVKLAIYA